MAPHRWQRTRTPGPPKGVRGQTGDFPTAKRLGVVARIPASGARRSPLGAQNRVAVLALGGRRGSIGLHFHYVLSMGAVFALFSGFYFWIGKLTGYQYNVVLSQIQFWTLFVGVFTTGIMFFHLESRGLISPMSLLLHLHRFYTHINKPDDSSNYVMFFKNVKHSSRDIYKKLKGKSGVYLFINNITNDFYVGSSIALSRRMAYHFFMANSDKDTTILLYRAMRKYKLDNFSLAILEFCASDLIVCSDLEKNWINFYQPRYNLLKIPGSSSGFRHSLNTINKLKELFRKENHPKYGYVSSAATRKAISDGIKEFYRTHTHPSKGLKGKLSPQYGIGGIFVFCYNKEGKELIFPSINGARQHFNVPYTTIKKNIDTSKFIFLLSEEWVIQSKPRPPVNNK